MIPSYINENEILRNIRQAIAEDIKDGDHTTLAVIRDGHPGSAQLVTREGGVIAGLKVGELIFREFNPDLSLEKNFEDGDTIEEGDIIFEVNGHCRDILSAERLVLNFIQRMSGIATKTRKLIEKTDNNQVKILDTRKTTPNLRLFEKWAVSLGGGENHRMGLYDMILLKDNHIDFAGGIEKAILAANNYLREKNYDLKIEIETRNLAEVEEVIRTGGVDMIMLDNMTPEELKKAVNRINGKYKTEASGNITENNIKQVAETGVDFISVGALTHSVKSLDLSLKIKI